MDGGAPSKDVAAIVPALLISQSSNAHKSRERSSRICKEVAVPGKNMTSIVNQHAGESPAANESHNR